MAITISINSIQHAELCRRKLLLNEHKKLTPAALLKHRVATVMVGILTFSSLANAAIPNIEVFNGLTELSDSDLENMRGRFASNNQVLYFGVEMISQWQTQSGQLATAAANLTIDFRNNHTDQPTVQFVPTVSIENQTPVVINSDSNQPILVGNNNLGSGGVANVSGVSQNIQVAGQSNKIENGINMQVEFMSSQNSGSISTAVQSKAGSLSATTSDGTSAMVTIANNSIGVMIQMPEQGQVLQQIRNQGMLQSAFIGGDLNRIQNTIIMRIGLNSASGNNFGSGYNAIQSLKDLQRNGLF